MSTALSRRARTAAATAVAASAVCAALLVPAAAHAAAPAAQQIKLSVSELPNSPLIQDLTRGGETANFQFTATNSGDKAAAFSPVVHGLPFKGTVPITGSLLNFHAYPINAPATSTFAGGQDGAALEYLFPKGGKAGDDFTVPAHSSLTWRIVVGVAKGYPATDSGLVLHFESEDADVATASIDFTTKGNALPTAKPLVISIGEYPGTPVLKTLTPGGKATTFQLTVTNPGDVDEKLAPVLHIFTAKQLAEIHSGDLTFHAYPVIAPKTDVVAGGQDGAALEYLVPKGGKADESSFTLPAHDEFTWRIVLGLKKGFQVKERGLLVDAESNSLNVKGAKLLLTTLASGGSTATPSPSAKPTTKPTAKPTTKPTPATNSVTGGTNTPGTNTPGTNTGELAHTGSSGSAAIGLTAAALLSLGAAMTFVTARRRRTNPA